MSPYPAQVNREAIIRRAREILEAQGVERLTLQYLAAQLGIQAPSLYRYFKNKNELLRAVNEETGRHLIAAIQAAATHGGPETRILNMARAYREFARQQPVTYSLVFASAQPDVRPAPDALEGLILPIQKAMADVVGEANSLPALRGMLALLHGFVSLELSERFQRGSDFDATYDAVVAAYLRGWQEAKQTLS